MKLTLESTDRIVTLNVNGADVPARIWQGQTDSGIPVHAYITRVAVATDQDCTSFERELTETAPLRPELQTIPLRLIL